MKIIKLIKSKILNYILIVAITTGMIIYFFALRAELLDNCEYGYNRYEHSYDHATWKYGFSRYSPFNDLAIFEYIYQYGVLYNSSEEGRNVLLDAFYEEAMDKGMDENDPEYRYVMEYYYGGFSVLEYINGHTERELCTFPNILYAGIKDDFCTSFFRGKVYVIERWERWNGKDWDDNARLCRFMGM